MAYGITRIHGAAHPGTFTGGYQLRFFTIAASGFYTDTAGTVYTDVASGPNSKFEGAVRAIEEVATVVVLGLPTSSGFTVGVDGGDFYGRDDHTGYAADTSASVLAAAINAYTGINPTVTEVTMNGLGLS